MTLPDCATVARQNPDSVRMLSSMLKVSIRGIKPPWIWLFAIAVINSFGGSSKTVIPRLLISKYMGSELK